MKTIYEFRVYKTNESGEKEPIDFCVKRPSYSEKEEAELIRAEYWSKYTKRGILTEAILSRTYDNQGGTITDNERMMLVVLQVQFGQKQEEYKQLGVEKASKEVLEAKAKEIADLYNKIIEINVRQSAFYENTAEFKAKSKMIAYLTGILTYHKNSEGEWVRYFKSDILEEILEEAEALEEKEDSVYKAVKDKILFAVSYYVHNPEITDKTKEEISKHLDQLE